VPDPRFAAVIERTLDELPTPFAQRLDNVVVLVEPVWAEDPHTYGLYDGIPLTDRSSGSQDLRGPDRIFLFSRPLTEDFGHDPALLETEIRRTLLHELAHHFGIDDDRLDELGWS
jgi:predicted Zn-dependent protease with MMP-like domain